MAEEWLVSDKSESVLRIILPRTSSTKVCLGCDPVRDSKNTAENTKHLPRRRELTHCQLVGRVRGSIIYMTPAGPRPKARARLPNYPAEGYRITRDRSPS
ncbi:hypothetical protein AVEN_180221-1 [Araneus ventricosus]|uniref:Uncharacterized protein n=1 Tax=Araneus ventricosus TaxID=182803 RepID=A0A4Y2N034_ARAVE|nr:hypothetical protein AVEN_180221-1 [Araneus ventricosus]